MERPGQKTYQSSKIGWMWCDLLAPKMTASSSWSALWYFNHLSAKPTLFRRTSNGVRFISSGVGDWGPVKMHARICSKSALGGGNISYIWTVGFWKAIAFALNFRIPEDATLTTQWLSLAFDMSNLSASVASIKYDYCYLLIIVVLITIGHDPSYGKARARLINSNTGHRISAMGIIVIWR